jgi:hypothetical protein
MIRGYKPGQWDAHLELSDLRYLTERIEPDAWYPMETFERMGLAILAEIQPSLEAIRFWGRFSVDALARANPSLVVPGDALDTLARFRVLRASFFDYAALAVTDVSHGEANLVISYEMSPRAEEAASYQTVGFFERLLEVAGATLITASFTSKSWEGELVTTARLLWREP